MFGDVLIRFSYFWEIGEHRFLRISWRGLLLFLVLWVLKEILYFFEFIEGGRFERLFIGLNSVLYYCFLLLKLFQFAIEHLGVLPVSLFVGLEFDHLNANSSTFLNFFRCFFTP